MKQKYLSIFSLFFILIFATSCFDDLKIKFDKEGIIEFEDAVRRTPTSGAIFPIIAITRTSGQQSLQVNLVGQQLKSPQELSISVDTTISALLNSTTIRAVEGTHFSLNGGKFTMKSDTSFSAFRFNIQNITPVAGRSALVVLKLEGGNSLKVNENYRRVGFRINLQ